MTTHAGWRDGRTLCGAWRGFNAQWREGFSGPPGVDCPRCLSAMGKQKETKP